MRQHRLQRTIERPAEVHGVGLFTGADVRLQFLPAPAGHGIAFQRLDCPGSEPIPATIAHAVQRRRRTAIEHRGVAVEMTEHVLASLVGLGIDNCLITLNAPEPPGCDGSALAFVNSLLDAGIVEQDQPRSLFVIENAVRVRDEDGYGEIAAKPLSRPTLAISYHLDYGARSPIRPQTLTVEISPTTFICELASSRTFVLESEVAMLRAQGYGTRTTCQDLLVFGPAGIIDNTLRFEDECVRHKILDCLGDFALLGCDVVGHFSAYRSGHRLNVEIINRLKLAHPQYSCVARSRAA